MRRGRVAASHRTSLVGGVHWLDWPCWPEPRPKAHRPPTRCTAREARRLGEQSSDSQGQYGPGVSAPWRRSPRGIDPPTSRAVSGPLELSLSARARSGLSTPHVHATRPPQGGWRARVDIRLGTQPLAQRVERRDRDEIADALDQALIRAHERALRSWASATYSASYVVSRSSSRASSTRGAGVRHRRGAGSSGR